MRSSMLDTPKKMYTPGTRLESSHNESMRSSVHMASLQATPNQPLITGASRGSGYGQALNHAEVRQCYHGGRGMATAMSVTVFETAASVQRQLVDATEILAPLPRISVRASDWCLLSLPKLCPCFGAHACMHVLILCPGTHALHVAASHARAIPPDTCALLGPALGRSSWGCALMHGATSTFEMPP